MDWRKYPCLQVPNLYCMLMKSWCINLSVHSMITTYFNLNRMQFPTRLLRIVWLLMQQNVNIVNQQERSSLASILSSLWEIFKCAFEISGIWPHANIHTSCNVVLLVWASLRLAPITSKARRTLCFIYRKLQICGFFSDNQTVYHLGSPPAWIFLCCVGPASPKRNW